MIRFAGRPEVTVVGELNPDLILYGLPEELPPEHEHMASGFSMTLGSSSAILAHNLSVLGTRVQFFGKIGNDLFGRFCEELLQEAGVQVHLRTPTDNNIGTGVTIILPHGEKRRILTYAGSMAELGLGDLDLDSLAAARHFHLSSLYLQDKLLPDTPFLFSTMKSRGLSTSLDTNDDPEGRWGPPFHEVLPHTDILFCNERELCRMASSADPDQAALELSREVRLLIVKHGARGASAYQAGSAAVFGAGVPIDHAIDSVGAGDSFAAGFLHGYLQGHPISECLGFANLTGALSVTRAGGVQAFRERGYALQFLRSLASRSIRLSDP